MTKLRNRRTSKIIDSKEARLLREIRLHSNTSILSVSKTLGLSESYIRHIEKGRLDFPEGGRLREILRCYGVSLSQFKKKLMHFSATSYRNDIQLELDYLTDDKLLLVLKLIRALR